MTELEYMKKVEEITENKATVEQKIYELLQKIDTLETKIVEKNKIINDCFKTLKIYGDISNWENISDEYGENIGENQFFSYKDDKEGYLLAQKILCKHFLMGEYNNDKK